MFKINNEKLARGRVELSCFSFDFIYRSGKGNATMDALSRVRESLKSIEDLQKVHNNLCRRCIIRIMHVVQTFNLTFFQLSN